MAHNLTLRSKRIRVLVALIAGCVMLVMPVSAAKLPKPLTDDDYYPRDPRKEELGRLLAFDKELSGNRNISCLTCHHPYRGTSDGLSLPIGEGGAGLGVTRDTGEGLDAVHERVPRNAPALFNLGAREFTVLFHDGRVAVDESQPSGFVSPAGDALPLGLDNVLAAQALFPVTSGTEMAGQPLENSIADATAAGNLAGAGGVWQQLAGRLQAIPEYVERFKQAYPDVSAAGDITIVHVANAIAAFEAMAWRCDNSPFDRYLRGDKKAMSGLAQKGMKLFYGKAGCGSCHSGPLQTDHGFHAIAMPQIGPGKGDNALDVYNDGRDDLGLGRETGNPADNHKFRTPSLRQLIVTQPYGHAGAYATVEAVIRHHLDPIAGLENYDRSQAVLQPRDDLDALDFVVMDDPVRRQLIADANELQPNPKLRDEDVDALVKFMYALTDFACINLNADVPMEGVPSQLPLFD